MKLPLWAHRLKCKACRDLHNFVEREKRRCRAPCQREVERQEQQRKQELGCDDAIEGSLR